MNLLEISSRRLLAGTVIAAMVPFLMVELFKPYLYTVMAISPYLVFHNTVEFFSVMVSLSIFGLGWYSYDQSRDSHSLFLSVAFLAVGLMDFMHTLSYSGMPPLITPNVTNKATLLWVAVRFFGASMFLASAFVSPGKAGFWLSKAVLMAGALSLSSLVFVGIIFFPDYLPAAFVQGSGLTPFKMMSEYVIVALMVLACIAYSRRLARTGEKLIQYYLAAFVICIFSELAFTLYKSAFDTYNMLGHIYKTCAFMLIYKGMFIASVRKPYEELLVANNSIRLSRNMLSHVMNSIPQSIFWKDRDSVYLGCNEVFARQAGLASPELIVGKTDYDLPWSHEESRGYCADDREVMRSATAKCHIIETQRQADGSTIWIDTTKIPFTDQDGSVRGVLGVYDDITWRKQAEEDLKEALLFNQQVINSAQEGIVVHDRELRYRLWNPFMEELTGVESGDVMGKTPLEAFPYLNNCGLMEMLAQVLADEKPAASEFYFEDPNTGKSGWIAYTCAPVLNTKGEVVGIIRMNRNNTENRKIEEQLRQSQKMEALGQLAGGVAHDFNNMLQVIIGYASLASMTATDSQKEQIAEILAASERASELTSGLLSYSRKQVFKIEPTDLVKLIGDVEKFLRRILGEDIAFTFTLDQPSEALVADIDRAHMQQVFVNLASNARDAMASGGSLSIRMEKIAIDEEFVHAHGFGIAGPYAHVTVSDTGCGIAKEHLHKIFEPFFTTKELGRGTGLGLSIVYGIIAQHNGFIRCYSEEGTGTAFHIYLPLSSGEALKQEVAPQDGAGDAEGKTLLVAEDDPAVRAITRTILEQHGYVVMEASNGREAVEVFREQEGNIDLVILDALMPGLNGVEALVAIREIKPDTKALFMSGYAREIIGGKMLIPDDARFICKPVLPARLIEAIREIVR